MSTIAERLEKAEAALKKIVELKNYNDKADAMKIAREYFEQREQPK